MFYLLLSKNWNDGDLVQKLSDLILFNEFTARVEQCIDGMIYVRLSNESGVNILQQLITTPLENLESVVAIPSELDVAVPAPEILMYLSPVIPSDSVQVFVSHITAPDDFYIQLGASSDMLSEMSQALQDQYDQLQPHEQLLTNLAVGSVCCARYKFNVFE